jgi:hypothetical protein
MRVLRQGGRPAEKWPLIMALLVAAFFCLRYLKTGRVL